jgi:hypothetical protein
MPQAAEDRAESAIKTVVLVFARAARFSRFSRFSGLRLTIVRSGAGLLQV